MSIDENNSPPTVVSSISVSDDNSGTNNLSLSGTDASAFNINSNDELEFTEEADYESKSSYSVTVEVNDPEVGSDPNDTEDFLLSINDVNEPPTVATNTELSINEGAKKTLTTSELSASDPDDGASALIFKVTSESTQGDLLVNGSSVTSFTQADLENGNVEYDHTSEDGSDDSFTFKVEDGGGKATPEETFSIAVNATNDAPTVSLSPTSTSIDENNGTPTVVSNIDVSDDELGTNELSLSGTDASAFNINSNDELEFTEEADYESKSSYSVTVEVNDPEVGSDPNDTEDFSLSINDVNEAPTAPTGLTASAGNQRVNLSWESNTESDMSGGSYQVHRSTVSEFNPGSSTLLTTVSHTGGGENYVDDASDLSRQQSYHYRVLPISSAGVAGSPSEEVVVQLPPQMVAVETSLSFGDATTESSYRPVALPGGASTDLSSVVSGEPGPEGDYRAYREEGATDEQDYSVVECAVEGGADCSFEAGRGLWLLSKTGWSTPDSLQNVALSENGTYSVSLNDGWNLVANPFSVNVSWSAVQQATGTGLSPLYERTQSGSWTQASTMTSATTGTGYYVKNEGDLDHMILPHPTATDSAGTTVRSGRSSKTKPLLSRARAEAQTVALGIYAGEQRRGGVTVGLSPAAKTGLDTLDVEAPPSPFATVMLRAAAETDDGRERLLRDYRPVDGEGQRFALRLAMPKQEMVRVRAESLDVPDRYEVVLVERSVGRTHDLRKESAALHPENDRSTLVLLVGTPAYVEKQRKALAPDKVKLLGNYPNPVTRATTLEYALPEKQDVRLALYDVLGRRVQVLVDERQRAGFHRVRWTGAKQLASGVYFYRLRAGETTKVKKMTVVR